MRLLIQALADMWLVTRALLLSPLRGRTYIDFEKRTYWTERE